MQQLFFVSYEKDEYDTGFVEGQSFEEFIKV